MYHFIGAIHKSGRPAIRFSTSLCSDGIFAIAGSHKDLWSDPYIYVFCTCPLDGSMEWFWCNVLIDIIIVQSSMDLSIVEGLL